MGIFEQFPYTNCHAVNLKWILDRLADFETRLTTAEGKISSLEDRMDTAESDIDALEGRMDTAEDDIDKLQADVGDVTLLQTTDKSSLVAAVNENEGRRDTAEGDIDALETQMPKSLAGDAGKVLTATGAGEASWQDVPEEIFYYDVTRPEEGAATIPDPTAAAEAAIAGKLVIVRVQPLGSYPQITQPVHAAKSTTARRELYFYDINLVFQNLFDMQESPVANCPLLIKKNLNTQEITIEQTAL